jgi:hypothetical protein
MRPKKEESRELGAGSREQSKDPLMGGVRSVL